MVDRHPVSSADGHAEKPVVHHETSDIDIRSVLGFGAGLVVVAVLIHLLIFTLFRYFDAREARRQAVEYPLAAGEAARLPPEPRLQTNPRQDLNDLREHEEQILTTYGWVDRNAGLVRIPIDAAMRLTIRRGLPARDVEKVKK